MPTIAIYRENTLIWSKEFPDSTDGHYDLGPDSPECEMGDLILFSIPSGRADCDHYSFIDSVENLKAEGRIVNTAGAKTTDKGRILKIGVMMPPCC